MKAKKLGNGTKQSSHAGDQNAEWLRNLIAEGEAAPGEGGGAQILRGDEVGAPTARNAIATAPTSGTGPNGRGRELRHEPAHSVRAIEGESRQRQL